MVLTLLYQTYLPKQNCRTSSAQIDDVTINIPTSDVPSRVNMQARARMHTTYKKRIDKTKQKSYPLKMQKSMRRSVIKEPPKINPV